MEFLFGLAVGFTAGFLVKHYIKEINDPLAAPPQLDDYASQEGDYRD